MGPGAIALTSILTPLTAASLAFCVYKWALWLHRKGFQWSLAQVVLIGNIIGNISKSNLSTFNYGTCSNGCVSSIDQRVRGSDVLSAIVPEFVQSSVRYGQLAFRFVDDFIDFFLLVRDLMVLLMSSNLGK
jgi:hypothetical protein